MLFDILFFSFSLLIIALSYFLLFKKKKLPPPPTQEEDILGGGRQGVVEGRRREEEGERREEEGGRREEGEVEREDGDKSKRDLMKEAKKKEKQERKEAMKQMIEVKEKKNEERRKKDEERERKREEEEQKREEEERKRQEEERKKEEEEYKKWKDMFAVEEEGLHGEKENEEQNLMQKFIDYIKLRKVVLLEDLSAEFKLPTKDIINRIRNLEELKILNGVIDERGKYIYITQKEMESVASFIKTKGRVSRADLLIECNKIIKLNPSGKDKEALQEEEEKILKEAEQQFELIQQNLEQPIVQSPSI